MRVFRGLAAIAGVGILAAVAHVTITATGGYGWNTNSPLTIALAVGVAMGAPVAGVCFEHRRWMLGLCIVLALIAGELYGFGAMASWHVANLEAQAAPIHELEAKRKEAEAWFARLERDDRVQRAERAAQTARADANASSRDKGCGPSCKATLAKTVDVAEAAVEEARQSLQLDQRQARAALEHATMPPSASPLADRLGLQPWVLDLIFAGLRSFACTVLAAGLLAFAAHGRRAHEVPAPAALAEPRASHEPRKPIAEWVQSAAPSNVVSISKRKPLSVIDFGAERLEAAPGDALDFDEFFKAYVAEAEASNMRAHAVDEFVEPFKKLCAEVGIRTRKRGSKLFLCDVKLAS